MAESSGRTDFDEPDKGAAGVFALATSAMAALGTVWIFVTMFMIVADVLGRNFFNAPITGVAEVAGRSVVAIVFLQIASAISQGRMTRADFLINMVAARSRALANLLEGVYALIGAAVFALIAIACWPDLANTWRTNDFFGVQGIFTIPTWPFWAINVIGSVAAAVAYLIAMAGRIARRVS